jgi:hypothetical protein
MKKPNITPGPWGFCFESAAQARRNHPGTDGGGGSGSIFDKAAFKSRYDRTTIAHLPHHREVSEDKTREANARAIAALPDLLAALETALNLLECANDHQREAGRLEYDTQTARDALIKAGYEFP